MNIKLISFSFLLIIIGMHYSCNENKNPKIHLFAATGTMQPSIEICESVNKNYFIDIEKNFAASGDLARQIMAGANADIYISANKQWIDYLDKNHLIIENAVSELAKNKLVIICPIDQEIELNFLKDFDILSSVKDKIAIGDPKYVPVGKYAKQFLDSLNWYDQLQNKIILAKDVTSVLHYVELGECDWGIVYYSEAIKSEKVKIAYEIPQELYSPIIFYIALLKDNQQNRELFQYFKTNKAKDILNKYGFTINI